MACGDPAFERLQTRWIDRSALSKAYQLRAGEKFVFDDDKIYIQDSGGNYIGTVDSRDCIVSEQRPINDVLAAFVKETAPHAAPTFKVGDEVEWDETAIGGICASTIAEVNEFNAMLTGNGWTNWQMPVSKLRHRAKPKQKQFKVGDVVIWQADNGRAHCGEIIGLNAETPNIKATARILVTGPYGSDTFAESLDKLEHRVDDGRFGELIIFRGRWGLFSEGWWQIIRRIRHFSNQKSALENNQMGLTSEILGEFFRRSVLNRPVAASFSFLIFLLRQWLGPLQHAHQERRMIWVRWLWPLIIWTVHPLHIIGL